MITKFKITRLPIRASLTIDGIDVVLDQEYSITKQEVMVATAYSKGNPYDDFLFRVGNNDGLWSNEAKCTINVNTTLVMPSCTPIVVNIQSGEENDLSGPIPIVWEDWTQIHFNSQDEMCNHTNTALLNYPFFPYDVYVAATVELPANDIELYKLVEGVLIRMTLDDLPPLDLVPLLAGEIVYMVNLEGNPTEYDARVQTEDPLTIQAFTETCK